MKKSLTGIAGGTKKCIILTKTSKIYIVYSIRTKERIIFVLI